MTLFTILVVYSKKRKLRVYEIYPSTHKGTPSNKGIKLSVVLYKKRPAAAACAVVPYSYEYPNEEMRKGSKRISHVLLSAAVAVMVPFLRYIIRYSYTVKKRVILLAKIKVIKVLRSI